jgi:hypothetical protein
MADTLSTFTNFGVLPKELRLLAWEQAVNSIEPKSVVIEPLYILNHEGAVIVDTFRGYKARPSDVSPVMLQTSSEARAVVLKSYRRMFEDTAPPSFPIYFNPDRDSLHLRDCDPKWEGKIPDWPKAPEELALIKNLVIYDSRDSPLKLPASYPFGLAAFESLGSLSIPSGRGDPATAMKSLVARRENESPKAAEILRSFPLPEAEDPASVEQYENQVTAAMASFWTTKMHPIQIGRGKPVTPPPRLIFLTWEQVEAFNEKTPSLDRTRNTYSLVMQNLRSFIASRRARASNNNGQLPR